MNNENDEVVDSLSELQLAMTALKIAQEWIIKLCNSSEDSSAIRRYELALSQLNNAVSSAINAYYVLANGQAPKHLEREVRLSNTDAAFRLHSTFVPNAPLLADWQSKSVPEMEAAVEAHCLASGNNPAHKIERIKAYRKLTAQGLAESLKWVDSHFKH